MTNKKITLDYTDYTISEAIYTQIKTMILEQGKVCQYCGIAYTLDNPEVAQNTCLQDMLKRNELFTFIGTKEQEGWTYYTFLYTNENNSRNNYIAVCSPKYKSERLETSEVETLQHYGFTYPNKYNDKYLSSWSIIGDVATSNKVLIKAYFNSWDSNGKYVSKWVELISIKNQGYKEINKRKKVIQQAFKQAETQAKNKSSWYSFYDVSREALALLPTDLSLY